MAETFLSGVRVIEAGESRAVGFAGKLLADLGAEVWLLEAPGRGNRLRRRRPLLPNGVGGLFAFLARGKRSVSVDLELEDGQELTRRLADAADGVIADRAAWGRIEPGGAGLCPTAPRSIVTISSRGAPHADIPESEFVDALEGGIGYMTPGRVEDPLREYPLDLAGGGQASYVGGLYGAIAFLHGLALGRATGETVRNDVSLQAAAASMMVLNLPWWEYAGIVPSRLRAAGRPTRSVAGFVRVKDGRVSISMIEEHQWDGLLRALGAPEWAALPAFATQLSRSAHWEALRACLEDELKDTPAQEVMERCQAQNVPVFVVREMEAVLASVHERARGFFAPSEPDGVLLPTNPWLIDGAPVSAHGRSPALGEHTLEALRLLGMDVDDFDFFREAGVV
ncbi:MAG TPA: CaiB/BaiF CoA-transferase family protein [Dehalococcoidia bacterium]|nr:CaiB/BaiF CoA-transferase family protein [Dehalococcoidia bacterium]